MMTDSEGTIRTGLLYLNEDMPDMHAANHLPRTPLNALPFNQLNPGAKALAGLQKRYR